MSRADIIPAIHLVPWRVTQLKTALDIEQRCTPWHWSRHAQLVAESLSSEGLLGFVEMWGENEGSVGNESAVAPQPCLFNLCVVPHARRSGIARALLDACEDACLDWGGSVLALRRSWLRRAGIPDDVLGWRARLAGWLEGWPEVAPLRLMRKRLSPAATDMPAVERACRSGARDDTTMLRLQGPHGTSSAPFANASRH
ncbi:hypothetical protein EMIHUDRAFT_217217 [Emiliania huxleyi CCMP1516]|uniref:N-acetyltransferase domain-containing protein n=2 Tax=Emiliania huxleyi TaxID=2903 RepID=A0A0D3IB90_EMIH1|nr:hypothetical protein EMIHUDRAFT_217217 [Emiliania huxleyi CCMP1516]EOD08525.1 hypothetical protein EMIHUDRAFT_217217 [Emiliania huxleyi CCMP1516]|eukprot:XP_005760954.1 hypothetical protein EMIHUDRAFT_217217 [Emiliania huxleyi CCMP1516]